MKFHLSYFLLAFTSIFTIVNPFGAMPFYTSITSDADAEFAKKVAARASWAAFIAMIFFGLSGQFIFGFFNVSLDGLRVVGGVLFFIMGYDMLQGKDSRTKTLSAAERMSVHDVQVKAITPLAIPLICGPGTITVVTVMMQETNSLMKRFLLCLTCALVCLASYYILISAKRISQFLGESGQKVFYRLMGLILMMIAVEFFFAGIKPYIQHLTS